MSTTLGDRIRALRKEKGLSLDELASRCGCSKSYIWELENKNPPRPSADKLSAISNQFGMTMDALLGKASSEESADADPVDSMFFRKYQKMDPETKKKIRKMVDLWDDD